MSDSRSSTTALMREYSRHGSADAFAELVRRYLPVVYGVALRHCGDPATADDIAQHVFIHFARRLPSLRASERIGAWLHRASILRARDVMKSERRRKRREQKAAEMMEIDRLPEPERWPALSPVVDRALASLRKPDREVLVLRYHEGKKLGSVAKALGTTEAAAKKRLSRALARLRTKLKSSSVVIGVGTLGSLMSGSIAEGATISKRAIAEVSDTALGTLQSGGALVWWFQHGPLMRYAALGAAATLVCGSFPIAARLKEEPDPPRRTTGAPAKLTAISPRQPVPFAIAAPSRKPSVEDGLEIAEIVERLGALFSAELSELDKARMWILLRMIPDEDAREALLLMDAQWTHEMKDRSDQYRVDLCRDWAKHEPDAALDWVLTKLHPGNQEYFERMYWGSTVGFILRDWSKRDWPAAWVRVQKGVQDGSLLAGDSRYDLPQGVSSGIEEQLIAREGLRTTISFVADLQSRSGASLSASGALRTLVPQVKEDGDFRYFLDVASQLPSPNNRIYLKQYLLRSWARKNWAAAREWVAALPSAAERSHFGWDLPLPENDVGTHLDWVLQQDPSLPRQLRYSAFLLTNQWMRREPGAATQWLLKNNSLGSIAPQSLIMTLHSQRQETNGKLPPPLPEGWRENADLLMLTWREAQPEEFERHIKSIRRNNPEYRPEIDELVPKLSQ